MLMREHIFSMTLNFNCERERSGTIEVINMLPFMFLIFQFLFDFYLVMLRYVKMTCADIGPTCPAGALHIEKLVLVRDMVVHNSEATEEIRDVEENL